MTFANWCVFLGVLLMLMALSNSVLKSLPFSSAAIYMFIGVAAGPHGLGLIGLSLADQDEAHIVELLTEVVVLISLFAVGLKLPVRSKRVSWKIPVLLATVAMVITIVAMTMAGVALGWSISASLFIAAILAPTDPVLASEVQVSDVGDRDALRFGLTAEGGLNDGTAFPFVMLALGLLGTHELGSFGLRWFGLDVVWAVVGGLALGWLCGAGFTRLVVLLRHRKGLALGMESFLALGLIGLTYGVAIHASVYGFLAVFVAGLGMRDVERDARPSSASSASGSAAEVSTLAMEFVEDLEKFAEMAAMLIIGSLLSLEMMSWRNAAMAACLIFLVRPLAVYATTMPTDWTPQQRRIGAWLGIRGVGSMYYLAFALTHGLNGDSDAGPIVQVVLLTIAVSVLLHGISATPVMKLYRQQSGRS